jgi:predicted nucleic acid-binding Zn ribbon protein
VGEVARRKCDKCGGRLEKLVSRTAFVLKGGGWYNEGYSSGGGKKKESAAADGGESKPAKGEPKNKDSKDEGKKAAGSA